MREAIPVMQPEELQPLSTRQLLARLRRLRECEESRECCDRTSDELASITGIYFKSDTRWSAAFDDVRRVLATREHVLRGQVFRAQ